MKNFDFTMTIACGLWAFGCGDVRAGGGAGGMDSMGGGPTGGAPAEGGSVGVGGGGNGGGVVSTQTCEEGPSGEASFAFRDLRIQVASPVQIRSPPGRPDDLFIVQQTGQIIVVADGTPQAEPFLDLSSEIRVGAEEGLLGLAFHPDYEANGRFFVHYSSAGDGASTVMEYTRSAGDENLAIGTPAALAFQTPTVLPNHNGGAVEFGGDGYLYISLGDGGGANDPECDAQDPEQPLGKILRIDVDAAITAGGYPPAPGNPNGERPYHLGLRNAWRISFDPCTDDLYIGEVGQGAFEEVDVAPASAGPLNFGWPIREGTIAFDNDCPDLGATLHDPIAEYGHDVGCSITGGVVYRGAAIPPLRGWYFYGDYCTGTIWRLRSNAGRLASAPVDTGQIIPSLTAFGQDGHGEVYAVNLDGAVFKLEARTSSTAE